MVDLNSGIHLDPSRQLNLDLCLDTGLHLYSKPPPGSWPPCTLDPGLHWILASTYILSSIWLMASTWILSSTWILASTWNLAKPGTSPPPGSWYGITEMSGLGICSFQKNVPFFAFFSFLVKRTERSLRSFPFVLKERNDLCVLFCSF